MKDKSQVGAHIYIEDGPENIKLLQDLGVPVIIFTDSTNKHLDVSRADDWRADDWSEVEKIVMREYGS